MQSLFSHVFCAILAVTAMHFGGMTQQQEMKQIQTPDSNLKLRVEQLESRVERLEQVLFPTSPLSLEEAERRLDEARRTLKQSKRLFGQGYLSEAQVKHDEFIVDQALLETKLAKSSDNKERLSAELDVLKAEQAVDQASRELEYARKLLSRGYTPKYDVQRRERTLRDLERALEIAQQKLNLFEEEGSSPDSRKSPQSR